YMERPAKENVRHAEIFFDPQTHTTQGTPFKTVITGIRRAIEDAEARLGVSSRLIMFFLRHLSADSAMKTLEGALRYKKLITAVGLDSSEKGNPPKNFVEVFKKARQEGFLTVAHAGEEGPPQYIWEALNLLCVSRIDHGVRCLEDKKLVKRLVKDKIALTVCPFSNVKLRVFKCLKNHNIKKLLKKGLQVTINSDDPAYFGGYVAENLFETAKALKLTREDIYRIELNAFEASFLPQKEKQKYICELSKFNENSIRFGR
ncbi:MAG: adenosine deaminase, partial [Elusimicrobia bacterium]|nr:adenosine deaminase [Elusimicrobiota bacterium]